MISLKNIDLRLGTKVLLQQASLLISTGEKVSLVGRNGTGKSTLFALLNGQFREDAGDVDIPAHWTFSQVEQHMPETSETATEFVLQGDPKLVHAKENLERAFVEDDGLAIAQAFSDLADAGYYDASARAQAVILGLGFSADELDNPVNSFSGGWRMRLQLGRALMCPCDLLLLDEPTNHLDLDALVWLEAWLRRFEGTLLVISHDREFLDTVTDITVHLEHGSLNRYNGNYTAFEHLRVEKLEQQQAAYSKQQEKMAHLQQYIDRFRYKATKSRQAQSRIKALERMRRISAIISDAEFSFTFKEPINLPSPMLAIENADFGYAAGQTTDANIILRGVRRSVLAGQRIGILGANGQGKSTLVKTIARDLKPVGGTIVEGRGLAIGYFAQQELDVLQVGETPLAHMLELAKTIVSRCGQPVREQELRNFLGTFNINGEMVTQRVGTLSGGEKARLVLCMIVWQRPNLLLLDEPTNHLDLATREALSIALNQFDGTVILVSHDRALLRSVCDEFWLVEKGNIESFDGDLDDYQQYLLNRSRRVVSATQARNQQPSVGASVKTNAQSGKRLKVLEKALTANEQQTERARRLKDQYEEQLLGNTGYPAMRELTQQLEQIVSEIEELENLWLELQDDVERLRNEALQP